MKNITRRHRIGTIEEILKINTELQIKDYNNPGDTTFKVSRLVIEYPNNDPVLYKASGSHYEYDGIFTKDQLIEECNRKLS